MVGNLGDYQRIVELIKKVGGPTAAKAYAAVVAAGLMAAGGFAHKGYQAAAPGVKDWWASRQQGHDVPGVSYVVTTAAIDDQGLVLDVGDEFRVLTSDRDAVMIEVLGRDDNPWMVSARFLARISDFPAAEDFPD